MPFMPGRRTSLKTTSGRSVSSMPERLLRVAGHLGLVAGLESETP